MHNNPGWRFTVRLAFAKFRVRARLVRRSYAVAPSLCPLVQISIHRLHDLRSPITIPVSLSHPSYTSITTGSSHKQGTTLVVFTAIHAGAFVALFWTLLGGTLISTQVTKNSTPPCWLCALPPAHNLETLTPLFFRPLRTHIMAIRCVLLCFALMACCPKRAASSDPFCACCYAF
ncbi:hypothetical protein H4582DRAFT_748775 [Lactarius indigo]|nr:hypothetical protein H4582DRAFT_748775 [Lactarius indigo]